MKPNRPRRTTRPRRPKAAEIPQPEEPGLQGTQVQLARDAELLKAGYTFDVVAADRVCQFFELFVKHHKGRFAGKPFILADWQRQLIRRLFGWKRPDGTRRFRKLYLSVPRKNGKTTLAAGIALYLICADGEQGADVFCAANDKEQAKLLFKDAAAMVDMSPDLQGELEVFKTAILNVPWRSSLVPLSSEGANKDGFNPHAIVADELHEWDDRDLWEKLKTSMGSRQQPLFVCITTAGSDPNSIWAEEDKEAHDCNAGRIIDDALLAVIYEAPEGADWHSEEVWRAANPGWGVSVNPDFIREQHKEACRKPSYQAAFRRYFLNQRVSSVTTYFPMEKWDRCGKKPIDLAALAGKPCWLGLDLARRYDLTALVAVFLVDGEYIIIPKFFIPEQTRNDEGLEAREQVDKVPYREWAKAGHLIATPGNVTDYSFVLAEILKWHQLYRIERLSFDAALSGDLIPRLLDEGVPCVEFSQRIMSMSPPTKELLNLVLQERVQHGGNPILRWNAENARAYSDANANEKLIKGKSTGRIDGVIAAIMAIGGAMLGEGGESVYATRGAVIV